MTIEEILKLTPAEAVSALKVSNANVPTWETLEEAYDVDNHPVMDASSYPDKVKNNVTTKVTRIALGFQKLAAKRMTGLTFGIPVKRKYTAANDKEQIVAKLMENIFTRNRINSINTKRGRALFSECEIFTLWYSKVEENYLYGEKSPLKLRCKTYSPKSGYSVYPRYDVYDDMISVAIGYTKKVDGKESEFLDVYTKDKHILYKKDSEWTEELNEAISILKIPGVYSCREEPIWEDTNNLVYEMEWTLSRNGNYIRKNSKPLVGAATKEKISRFGNDDDDVSLYWLGENGSMDYITWDQATESLKLQINFLKQFYFMQLQLPDVSYENMKSTPMSGESRKMMFIDAQMKVTDESGDILEFLDREINVVKAFMKKMWPSYLEAIDSLQVENEITPYNISDEKEEAETISTKIAGKAIMSRKEAMRRSGIQNVDEVYAEIMEEEQGNVLSE